MQLEVDCMYNFPLSLLFFVQSIDLTSSFIRFFVAVVHHSIRPSSFVHSFIRSFIHSTWQQKTFVLVLVITICHLSHPTSHPPPPKIYHRILNHLTTIPQPHNPMLLLLRLLLLLMIMLLLKNKPPLWTFLRQSPSHNTQSQRRQILAKLSITSSTNFLVRQRSPDFSARGCELRKFGEVGTGCLEGGASGGEEVGEGTFC